MRTTMFIFVLAFAACRSDSSPMNNMPDSPTGGSDGSGSGSGMVTTVKAIRMNQPTNGAMVTINAAVVVSHVSSKKSGSVWIQDAGGGQYSGIHVFCNYGGTHPDCTMTQAQIDALAVGTVVNVTGMFNSFLLSTAPTGAQPVLEIEAPTITATGATMAPVAVSVTADVVAKAQQASTGADPYKGTYVKVSGTFPVSSKMAMEFASTCSDMSTPPMMGTTYNGFEVSGGGQTLAIGLNFYNTLTYCLPCAGVAMPYPCTNAVAAQSFTSVTGIVEPNYNANGAVYLEISPVNDTDLPHS